MTNFNSGNETIDVLLDVLLDFMEDGKTTILHEAAVKGTFLHSIEKLLVTQSLINWCASLGRVKFVELIAQSGGNVNIVDKLGNTPLNYAAANGRYYLNEPIFYLSTWASF